MEANINYVGVRRIYERTQNQTALDLLVHYYCQQKKIEEATKFAPVLKGVTLSDGYIVGITNPAELIALIENGAQPVVTILARAKRISDVHVKKYLYCKNLIMVEDLNRELANRSVDDSFFELLSFMLENVPSQDFNKIAFSTIKSQIVEKLTNIRCRHNDEDGKHIKDLILIISKNVDTLLYLLYSSPYDDSSKMIMEAIEVVASFDDSREPLSKITNALYQRVTQMPNMNPETLLKHFKNNPMDLALLNATRKRSFTSYKMYLNDFCKGYHGNFIDTIVELIGKGTFELTGFALRNLPEIFDKRAHILNSWVTNGCETELDVYGISLVAGKVPEEELDQKYLKAIQGSKDDGKSFCMKPVDDKK